MGKSPPPASRQRFPENYVRLGTLRASNDIEGGISRKNEIPVVPASAFFWHSGNFGPMLPG
jgi:hypothetical protein